MSTAFFVHTDCLNHITPEGHAEQVARLQGILKALEQPEFSGLVRFESPMATQEQITRAHPAAYFERIKAIHPTQGQTTLDADTFMSRGSFEAALRSAGGGVAAVDLVISGNANNAFTAGRPPGHHAERETPMGFCLFGNVAIAAKHALDHHGLSRVAIVDFDVHHGNGTQDLLWDDDRVLFISSHQMPLYPGSGAASETGASGNVMNVPLNEGCAGPEMRAIYQRDVFPALKAFKPELILISAGFDAHRADPLAGLNWETEDFAWLTHGLCDIADVYCKGRIVSTLEGGYDLQALAESVAAHIDVLMERGK